MGPDKQPERLRVLMVSQRMLPYVAGAELQALHLSCALIRLGVAVRIITTKFVPDLESREEGESKTESNGTAAPPSG